ncbi:hypothetical protein ACFU8Q_03010 [Streptomyces sp. NPDC057543]|uniref:hypothetical protein n=1 Tax=Streptomyces sp. NPDC057543 TaxID=3346163 RepID=UPI00369539FC
MYPLGAIRVEHGNARFRIDVPSDRYVSMHAAWVRFAASGDLGRPAWDTSGPVMSFGPGAPAVVRVPRDEELRGWAPYRRNA